MSTQSVSVAPAPLKALTIARTFLAVIGMIAPRLGPRLFLLDMRTSPIGVYLARMFAVRNGVLALGLARLDVFRMPRAFVGVNVLVDLFDAFASIASWRRGELTTESAVMVTGTAFSAAALGAAAYAAMPADRDAAQSTDVARV